MAFSPCLSRKMQCQSPPRRPKSGPFWTILNNNYLAPNDYLFTLRDKEHVNCKPLLFPRDGLFPLPVEEKVIRRPLGWACQNSYWGEIYLPLPPAP